MSWWNPTTWGGDAAKYVAEEAMDAILDALTGVYVKIEENPRVVVAPVAGILAGVAAYQGVRAAGQKGGELVIKKTEEYLEEIKNEQNEELDTSDKEGD